MSALTRFFEWRSERASADETDGLSQRHQPAVAAEEQVVERRVAARRHGQTAQYRNIEITPLRSQRGVHLRTQGYPLHEIQRGILRRSARANENGGQRIEQFFHGCH